MEGGSGGSDVKQVFLSHCVSSLGDAAESLSQYLQSANYSVFICSSMAAGQDFRSLFSIKLLHLFTSHVAVFVCASFPSDRRTQVEVKRCKTLKDVRFAVSLNKSV